MKRVLLIALTILMLLSANAEGWRDGLSPQKPYSGSPKVDFDETFGYMLLIPSQKTAPQIGSTAKLQILVPREDVKLGNGIVVLNSVENGVEETIQVGSASVIIRKMTDEEKEAVLWGGGSIIEINTTTVLQPNTHYFVNMTESCFVSDKYKKGSWPIGDEKSWSFATETMNYVESLDYYRGDLSEGKTVKASEVIVGDTAKLSIHLADGGAAAIVCDQGNILADNYYLTTNGEVTVSFSGEGETQWGILFFDAEGNLEYQMQYTTEVSKAK